MQEVAASFAKEELAPHGAKWDEEKIFPLDTLRKAASLGFGGLYVKEDVGGSALTRFDGALIFQELSYGDVPVTAFLTIHNMVASVIDRYAQESARLTYLPRLVTMDSLASYCLTEPGSGSDAASLRTVAAKEGNEYVLTGTKVFISGAGVSDVYLVMARTSPEGHRGISAFIVEKDMPGVSFGQPERKLGWRCQPTTSVVLDKVRVPATSLVGKEGEGFKIAMAALDGGRINIAACSLGGASFCLDYARDYVQTRHQFGSAVADFQATQFKVADLATSLHASQLMVRQAAQLLDNKAPSATLAAAMAKRFATDHCFNIANECLQLLGGYGYLEDYPVQRFMRDLRVHSILEGTNEVMRIIINREIGRLQRNTP